MHQTLFNFGWDGFLGFLVLALAVAAGIVFLSDSKFREDKRREWEQKGKFPAVSEWGWWLLSALVMLILVGALIGMVLHDKFGPNRGPTGDQGTNKEFRNA